MPIDDGAIDDLRMNSPEIRSLGVSLSFDHGIPTHAITGTAYPIQEIQTEQEWSVRGISALCRLLPNGTFFSLFQEPSDLIVPETSQAGVSAGVIGHPLVVWHSPSGLIHSQDSVVFTFGPDVLSSTDVLTHTIDILNSPITAQYFQFVSPEF